MIWWGKLFVGKCLIIQNWGNYGNYYFDGRHPPSGLMWRWARMDKTPAQRRVGFCFFFFLFWSVWKVLTSPNERFHPGRLTWNIIMEVSKIIFLSKWVICRFHLTLPGCTWNMLFHYPQEDERLEPENTRYTPGSPEKHRLQTIMASGSIRSSSGVYIMYRFNRLTTGWRVSNSIGFYQDQRGRRAKQSGGNHAVPSGWPKGKYLVGEEQIDLGKNELVGKFFFQPLVPEQKLQEN